MHEGKICPRIAAMWQVPEQDADLWDCGSTEIIRPRESIRFMTKKERVVWLEQRRVAYAAAQEAQWAKEEARRLALSERRQSKLEAMSDRERASYEQQVAQFIEQHYRPDLLAINQGPEWLEVESTRLRARMLDSWPDLSWTHSLFTPSLFLRCN